MSCCSSRTSNLGLTLVKRLIYSVLIGLLVTAGFITIFGLVGLGISAAGIGVVKFFPWIAVLSGVVIVVIGAIKISGKTIHANIPLPRKLIYSVSGGSNNNNSNNAQSLSYTNFFLFGIGYAIASLSCTLQWHF